MSASYVWGIWPAELTTSPSEIRHSVDTEGCKCHGQRCLWGAYLVRPRRWKPWWPQYERRLGHRKHVSSKKRFLEDRTCVLTSPLSLCQSLFNHFDRNFCWPSCHFLSFFTPPLRSSNPLSLVGVWRLKFHAFLSPSLSYKANPTRGWCEEYKHIFFLLSRGKGVDVGVYVLGGWGVVTLGWAVGSVKESRALSQPSSSVIRRHDKVAARKTLQGWHNPKTD